MDSARNHILPSGFVQTCWRGIRVVLPADWEPARLCGPKDPTECTFVDRRFQRLRVHWQKVPRKPDLAEMYRRKAAGDGEGPRPTALKGVAGWRGLVYREGTGYVVHAGTFLPANHCLVQVVLTWPGRRDPRLEREVLTGIDAQPTEGGALWSALGLSARVAPEMEMVRGSSKVGRVRWDFRRAGRRSEGLILERLAMPNEFLTKPMGQWLGQEIPAGFATLSERAVDCGAAGGCERTSRGGSPFQRALRRGTSRLDRAWLCRAEERIYRLSYWRPATGPIDWPECLEVGCCGGVKPARGHGRPPGEAGG